MKLSCGNQVEVTRACALKTHKLLYSTKSSENTSPLGLVWDTELGQTHGLNFSCRHLRKPLGSWSDIWVKFRSRSLRRQFWKNVFTFNMSTCYLGEMGVLNKILRICRFWSCALFFSFQWFLKAKNTTSPWRKPSHSLVVGLELVSVVSQSVTMVPAGGWDYLLVSNSQLYPFCSYHILQPNKFQAQPHSSVFLMLLGMIFTPMSSIKLTLSC